MYNYLMYGRRSSFETRPGKEYRSPWWLATGGVATSGVIPKRNPFLAQLLIAVLCHWRYFSMPYIANIFYPIFFNLPCSKHDFGIAIILTDFAGSGHEPGRWVISP